MDTVRIARDFGTVSQLVPAPLGLVDAPYTVVNAIRMALLFLSWRENLPSDEQPPKRIWLDGEGLEAWFERIKQKREDEMKTGKNDDEWKGDMVQNDALKSLLVDD